MSSGFFVTAHLKSNDGKNLAEVKSALKAMCEATLKEPGCIQFDLLQDKKNESNFVLWEHFENEEAFKKHGEEAHTKKFISLGLIEMINVVIANKV